jgi:hypothetical protein
MRLFLSFFSVLLLFLTGCATSVQPYGLSVEGNASLKQLNISETIYVGEISDASVSDLMCRTLGPITIPNNSTPANYIKKALEDQLKLAGSYTSKTPKVVLGGAINKLEMSSSVGMTKGYWNIELTVRSSNGKSLKIIENHNFDTGFVAYTACANTATAFMPAVQNLINKLLTSPQFKDLVVSSAN